MRALARTSRRHVAAKVPVRDGIPKLARQGWDTKLQRLELDLRAPTAVTAMTNH